MKKDIFNGNISPIFRGTVIFSLILATVVFVGCGIFFLLTALFYENTEEAAKIFLYCFSAFSLIAGISYPILTLALFFLRSYVFAEKEEENRYRR